MDRNFQQPKTERKLALVLHAHQPYVRGTYSFQSSFLLHLHRKKPGLRLALAVSPTWLALCEREQSTDALLTIPLLRELKAAGSLEILACPATEAYFPLLCTEESVHAQLAVAVQEMKRLFGEAPQGFLLPACAYTGSSERMLRRLGVSYAVVSPMTGAAGRPPAVHVTPGGLAVFPAFHAGPPFRDELSAGSFLAGAADQLGTWVIDLFRTGNETVSDQTIDALCTEAFQQGVELVAPSDYLRDFPNEFGKAPARYLTWAPGGTAGSWFNEDSDILLRHLHEAELRFTRLSARLGAAADPLLYRALQQAARELLLTQSGDWFKRKHSASEKNYAAARFQNHLGCFNKLCTQIEKQAVDEDWLNVLESRDSLFPDLNPSVYTSSEQHISALQELANKTSVGPNIVMLAWEYPPKQVGGLACAVCDLAESLAELGVIVHVITSAHEDAPPLEQMRGVYVHRLPVLCSGTTDWIHWAFEMNLAMTDYLVGWKALGGRIDVLHAHDWMVYYAAREIKHSFGVPLIATIHATEWGRNQGNLHSPLQHRIHSLEWHLTYEAARVLVCSEYMREEVIRLFQLPPGKVLVFPNGVRTVTAVTNDAASEDRQCWAEDQEKIIFFIGRLVYEKGVKTLLEAMPLIHKRAPLTKLIIAGSGPMEDEWKRFAAPLGEKVLFVGFADAHFKDRLYRAADLVVIPSWYEPFGIVALEAMSRGKPLVISDTGGLAEIIDHGVDGYKALPGHVESLAYHVSELLLRPELGRSMAEAAVRKLKQRYDWSAIAAEIAGVYTELAGSDIFTNWRKPSIKPEVSSFEETALPEGQIPFIPSSSIRNPTGIELYQ